MFDVSTFNVSKFDDILSKGLSHGLGKQDGQMCIEAAICNVLGMDHGDDPKCVADSVRRFKIKLNDSGWSSPGARAAGLRDLGLAQLGSLRVVNDIDFSNLLSKKTISVLIPMLFREIFPNNKQCLEAVSLCEVEPNKENINKAVNAAADAAAAAAAYAAYAAAAAYAADAAAAAAAAYAAYAAAAAYAADAAAADAAAYAAADAAVDAADAAADAADAASIAVKSDKYLILSAQLALECLKELNSPGVQLLK